MQADEAKPLSVFLSGLWHSSILLEHCPRLAFNDEPEVDRWLRIGAMTTEGALDNFDNEVGTCLILMRLLGISPADIDGCGPSI